MFRLFDRLQLRVRYSETDQMGTFYNSRALEWFECGRSELMRRKLRMSYAALEARGVFLPLVEAHLEFQGGARYDDLLEIASTVEASGRAKLRFEVQIKHAGSGKPVVAAKVGAVNTVVITSERKLIGHNTDGPGFLTHLTKPVRVESK